MNPPGVLGQILEETRARLLANPVDLAALEERALSTPVGPDAMASLRTPGIRIIAEVKRRSPSAGALKQSADPITIAKTYEAAGAAAISVLTEPHHFGGSLEDLQQVTGACGLPALRKDFIVGRRQLLEARLAGASLVLLIAACLTDEELETLHSDALNLGLQPLVEAHTAEEVRRAVGSGSNLVGVNNRDLVSLQVDLAVAESLRTLIPNGVTAVAESGVRVRDDIERLRQAGYEAFLVGSSLMEADDPAAQLRRLWEPS